MKSEQIRFSKALRESERRYNKLIQGLPAAIYTCDPSGRVMLYNKAAVHLWGREPEVGKDLWCGSWRIYRTDGTPLPLDKCPMAIALSEARSVRGEEIVIERPDGVRRNVLPHPQPIFDESGNLVEAVNMLVDITDLKHIEQAFRESEERFRTMAEQASSIISISDLNNHAIYLNSSWSKFVGKPAEKGLGDRWRENIHPEDREKAFQDWQDAFAQRKPYNGRFRYRNAKGEYAFINANYSPRISQEGEFVGYIGILDDVTQQENAKSVLENLVQERTRELLKANAELRRSNLELEQFAYVASHDLQEPLRKIQTFSNLLEKQNKGTFSEESIKFLNNITSSATRLSLLIDDLLNFARLSTSKEIFEKVNPNVVLEKVKNDLELLITKNNATIHNEELPEIEAVPFQISQLFNNLLGNSLKFSSPDRSPVIHVKCRKLSMEEVTKYDELQHGVLHYEITFSDNGIGFEQEYADQIFQIFQRLHGQAVYPGSGIGLALCRKIVANHHGKIYAEGNESLGATFYIILPEKQPQEKD